MKDNKSIKEKFLDRKAPINKEALWAKISEHENFPQKEKSNNRWLWLSIICIALLIGVFGYLKFDFAGNSQLNKLEKFDKKSTELIGNEIASNETIQDNRVDENNEQLNSSEDSIVKNGSEKIKNETQALKSDSSASKDYLKNNESLDLDFTKEDRNTRYIGNSVGYESKSIKEELSDLTSDVSIAKQSKIKSKEEIHTNDKNKIDQKRSFPFIESNRDFVSMPSVDRLKFKTLLTDEFILAYPKLTELNIIDRSSNSNWQIFIGEHVYRSRHQIESNNGITEDLSTDLQDNLKAIESYSFSVGLQKRIFKNFRIGLGLELMNEQTKIESNSTDTSIVKNQNLNEGFYAYSIKNSKRTYFQQFKSLNVFASIERMINIKRSEIGIGLGAKMNLNFSQTGSYIDSFGNEFELANESFYQSKKRFSYFTSLSYDYAINKNFGAGLNLQYNLPINISQTNSTFKHSISSLGIGLRLNYGF